MTRLTIDTFISSANDSELSGYKLLAALKIYTEELHKNRLYPAFGDLIDLNTELENLILQRQSYQLRSNKIRGMDLENGKFVYEKARENITEYSMEQVFEFIDWSLPKIKEAVEEGRAIYDFVEKGLSIKEIGLIPIYKDEGYFCIENLERQATYVYRFILSKITSLDVNFQTLKTNLVEFYEDTPSPVCYENIKLELIRKYPSLPNPMMYNVETEIEFPFVETILPIAKRKLMQHLAS
jgi:hypothetical protein